MYEIDGYVLCYVLVAVLLLDVHLYYLLVLMFRLCSSKRCCSLLNSHGLLSR